MAKIKKRITKRKKTKRKKKKEVNPEMIFDSQVGKTDSLFVNNPDEKIDPVLEKNQQVNNKLFLIFIGLIFVGVFCISAFVFAVSSEQLSAGSLIRSATAELLDSTWEFTGWIFGSFFNKALSLSIIQKATAGLIQNSETLKAGLPSTEIKVFAAGLSEPMRQVWTSFSKFLGK